jgi:opacity protein-like surface antigen
MQVDGNPNFQNYAYQYKINHEHLALKTKWIAENALNMNPYLSASIGVGLNHSYGYSINPLISQEIPPPPFRSHTEAAFSYTVGAGFQHTIDCHFTIALGYELSSWGHSSLNRAQGQTSGHGLRLNNLYDQGITFNVSYIL